MPATKSEYRKRLLADRHAMNEEEIIAKSQLIIKAVIKLVRWEEIGRLHTFVGNEKLKEIDTTMLLVHSWEHYHNIQTAVPEVYQGNQFHSAAVMVKTAWRKGKFGILEPTNGQLLSPDERFDVIIVPVLGFDKSGHRLGYGKGMYDRFLATQPWAMTIGLCYELGFVDTMPVEIHDVPLKYIVTEKRVLNFTS